jgi:hypothetical protein
MTRLMSREPNEGAEQGFAATACVMHELEEAEVVRQLVLRDAAVRAQPGPQQRPEALDRVDVLWPKAVRLRETSLLQQSIHFFRLKETQPWLP